MLDRVRAMLVDTFDVVGVATDGQQALEIARRLDPDAIVLDINMPRFDGFQTMRALERMESRAAVVFLSLLNDDDHIGEAFRLGGRAYVLKSRMVTDLAAAIDHVLVGRRFVPSLPALLHVSGGGGHAVHVHDDEESLANALVWYFDVALHRGDATCLIATAPIRERVTARLQARGWDVDHSVGTTRYRAIDAHAAVADLMRDGLPDDLRLSQIVDDLDEYRRTACGDDASSRLTIAGNMSSVVLEAGNTTAALAIERLWNTHTKERPFLTVCCHAMSSFPDDASDVWSMMADEHSAVCHASDI
jgi:CheY-like chemotaxis protein